MIRLFVIVLFFFGYCSVLYGDLMKEMDKAEKKYSENVSQTLVAFMSLETMFANERVRELAKAAGKGQIEKINQLVGEGVDVNSLGKSNATPLFWAMRDIDGFKRLLELGANPNILFDDGGSVMHWAAQHKNVAYLKLALEFGGDPNLGDIKLNESPLFEVITHNLNARVALLINAGADVNHRNWAGETVIFLAARMNQYELVYKMLDEYHADYNIANLKTGDTLAHSIAYSGEHIDPSFSQEKWRVKVIEWLNLRGIKIPKWQPLIERGLVPPIK